MVVEEEDEEEEEEAEEESDFDSEFFLMEVKAPELELSLCSR